MQHIQSEVITHKRGAHLQPRSDYRLPSELCSWNVNYSSARHRCRRGIIKVFRFKKCLHVRCHEDSVSISKGQNLWTQACCCKLYYKKERSIAKANNDIGPLCHCLEDAHHMLQANYDGKYDRAILVVVDRPYYHREPCSNSQSIWHQQDHQAQSRYLDFCFSLPVAKVPKRSHPSNPP